MTSRTEHKITEQDAENIPHSAWRFAGQNEAVRYWEADVELPGGKMGIIRKTEYLESELLLKINAEMRKESTNQRYTAGMGSDTKGNMPMVQTASIPENVFHQELAPYIGAGDKDHLRWWIRQDKNERFRVTDKATRK